jgi:hypothetical protein
MMGRLALGFIIFLGAFVLKQRVKPRLTNGKQFDSITLYRLALATVKVQVVRVRADHERRTVRTTLTLYGMHETAAAVHQPFYFERNTSSAFERQQLALSHSAFHGV